MGLGVLRTRVIMAASNRGAGPAGIFLPTASIGGSHGNRWRCSGHAEGGWAAPRGSPSILPPPLEHPWPAGAPSEACWVLVAGIGRQGSRGERQLPWPCRNVPARWEWEPQGAPGPTAVAGGDLSRGFLAQSSPQRSGHGGGSPVLLLSLQLEFPQPKAAGEFRPAFFCLSSNFLRLCATRTGKARGGWH